MTSDVAVTQVFFTVDVETSMGGAWTRADWEPLTLDDCVYCRLADGRAAGVPLIMDTLEAAGLRGNFFVDSALHHLVGAEAFRDLCRAIADRGHDVQLHLHPAAIAYANLRRRGPVASCPPGVTDMIADLPVERQVELLAEGRDLVAEATGCAPAAFRSGNYSFGPALLEALSRTGFAVDLSANPAFPGGEALSGSHAPRRLGGLVELPVTQLLGHRVPGCGCRPLEVNAISSGEMRRALRQLRAGGQRAAVIVFHSFALTKSRRRGGSARLDRIVLRRLQDLSRFLADHGDQFVAARLSNCTRQTDWADTVTQGPNVWPTTTWPLLAARYVGQLASRF